MKDRSKELVEYAKKNGFTREDWIHSIEQLYAAQTDMMLDVNPDGITEQRTVFAQGHSIVITAHREFIN